jgi:preprotein translocase subunit Sec63
LQCWLHVDQQRSDMKKETRYEQLTKARETLGISEEATRDEIKRAFHDLIRQWHPDKSPKSNEKQKDKSRDIIGAYHTIMEYCREYKISFSKESVDKYRSAEELWWDKFGNDPMWGPMEKV